MNLDDPRILTPTILAITLILTIKLVLVISVVFILLGRH